MNEHISILDASILCGISQKKIRKLVAEKAIPYIKKGNKYYVEKDAVEEYKKTQKKKAKINVKKTQDVVNWIDISAEWGIDCWENGDSRDAKYNFIDLFAGAGGLSCGLAMAGFNPVATVEIMKEASDTYLYNFTKKGYDDNLHTGDIRDPIVKKALYDSVKNNHIHLIAGGFPCQGFSMAGNRVVADPRNSLYLEMLDIVKTIKPDFVLMENVEGLRSMLDGAVEQKILQDYKTIGYDINVTVLNSADYGVAQNRKRVIFVGNKHGINNYHPFPLFSEQNHKTLGEEIERFMSISENEAINHTFTKHSEEMQKKIMDCPEGKSLYGNYSDAWKKSPWNKPSCTIKENHGGVNLHPKLPRVLTPRELAALQSFPDDFIFKGAKKMQLVQIGNAVPPLLGKAVGLAIKNALRKLN